MKKYLINWDKVFPVLSQLTVIKTYIGIVASCTEDLQWLSSKDTRAKIEWRFQIAPSTIKYALNQLIEQGFIERVSRGWYVLNREYLLNG